MTSETAGSDWAKPDEPAVERGEVERGEVERGEVESGEVERGEVVDESRTDADESGDRPEPAPGEVTSPAKVLRIGSMVRQLLEEVRQAPLDEASRERLAEIYERSIVALVEALSPDLQEELRSLALPFQDDVIPSDAELRIVQAQLVGWLEGLFHGIQATLFAQQLAARQQLEQMHQLPPGQGLRGPGMPGQHVSGQPAPPAERSGTYL